MKPERYYSLQMNIHRKNRLEEQLVSVTDPTDFSRTLLPQMVEFDTLLRCHICKDFIKAPVLTPCGHTFCSLCIREYLNREMKCPLCLVELRESMLRSDFLVSEIVGSFKSIRAELIKFLEPGKCPPLDAGNQQGGCGSPIEIASGDPVEGTDENEQDEDEDDDVRIISMSKWENDDQQARQHLFSSPSARKRQRTDSPVVSTIDNMLVKPKTEAKLADAQCPICQRYFVLDYLQRTHLDECLNGIAGNVGAEEPSGSVATRNPVRQREPATETLSKPQVPKVDSEQFVIRYLESGQNRNFNRLPKLNYSSLSQSQLKQKLLALKLPTSGSRKQMISRYNHYEMLWNSNFLDSLELVDERELRRRLASWESTHNNSGSQTKSIISTMMGGATAKLKDFKNDRFDRKGWMLEHRHEFKELIKEARSKLGKKEEISIYSNHTELSQEKSIEFPQSQGSPSSAQMLPQGSQGQRENN
ncbi:LAMI_0G11804g1_1 [Lachancea mirantina]|uniref:Postreplication repair E3 ubiquitin-protein ligase RAD18 n=1 Tax=Lachancea mirantina TaxID=1230905 RepID=A0A1G4KB46_9SACH|nr:LAMI_0G11804g1_1 [Lachancea mirantina]